MLPLIVSARLVIVSSWQFRDGRDPSLRSGFTEKAHFPFHSAFLFSIQA